MESGSKRITFILNPASGTQSKAQVHGWIEQYIDRRIYLPEVVYTDHAGHATDIAEQCAGSGAFAVVAVGGDGTVNEVARALIHTDTALGIIPCGSGNGLARHLRIPLSAPKAMELINGGRVRLMDYGMMNDTPFFCTCGVGFDAFVSLKFSQAGRRGPLIYLEKALTEGLTYKPEVYHVEIDGNESTYKAFLIACGNASQYGNNAYIAPHAALSDGLLDVTILEPFTPLDVPALAFQLFNRTIDQNSCIKSFQCRRVRIRRSSPGVVHFDGDPMEMDTELDIRIVKDGLKVIGGRKPQKPKTILENRLKYIFGGRQTNK